MYKMQYLIKKSYKKVVLDKVTYYIPVIEKKVMLDDSYFNVDYDKLRKKYGNLPLYKNE